MCSGKGLGAGMLMETVLLMLVGAAGFLAGRASSYGGGASEEETEENGQENGGQGGKKIGKSGRDGRARPYVPDMEAWSVCSPVSGEIAENQEGDRPRVVIQPDGNRVYAPAGGKVTKLFPMGNAMLFTTEFGAELFIQAGDGEDELLNRYFRPRIVQNEVVGKGKLLMEFDRKGLEAEGVEPRVSVTVEACAYGGDVKTTAGQRVKTGEEILQVLEPRSPEFK